MLARPGVVALLAAVISMIGGCSRGDDALRREGMPDVLTVGNDDPEMQAAVDSARRSTQDLITRVTNAPSSQSDLSVKVRVAEGETVEHMWMTDVTYDGEVLQGRLNNDPVNLVGVKLGDTLRVRPADISDWMAVDRGRLVAGYSIRLLRARMTPPDRIRFDSSVGFTIDP